MNREVALTTDARALSPRVALQAARASTGAPHVLQHLDLAGLLRILRDRKWMIAAAVVLGLAAGLAVSLLKTPLYRAWVSLEVNARTVEVMDEQSRERQGQIGSNWDFVATQVGLLGSRAVAERAAQDLDLFNKPEFGGTAPAAADRLKAAAEQVAAGLKIDAPEEGQIVRFSYTSPDARTAALVANGVAESFINTTLQRRFEASAYARQFLESQIAKARADLEQSERQLVRYAQQEGIINFNGGVAADGSPLEGNSLQGESLAALNQALAQATARRVAAEGAYRSARAAGPTVEVNNSTQALRQSRAALQSEYQEKRTLMKPEHPDMISLRGRIDELDRQIARETAQVTGGRTNSLAQDYRGALAAERALQSRVSALKGSVLDLRGRSVRYTILQREVDTNRGLYDALLQRYKEIGVAGGISAAPVSIIDRAEVPGAPFTPNTPFNLVLGLAAGLLAGVSGAVGVELLRDTIKTKEDVRSKLALACLGQVPRRDAKSVFVEELKDSSSALSEAYSTIAASLRFATDQGTPRILLVTSTQPMEGKSSTALALAQTMARRGDRVLLVDADLRCPSFKAAAEDIGLTRLLTNSGALDDHVVATEFENLHLLPCGPLPPTPADLLSTPRFGAIMQESLDRFQTVIVDAPPVLELADAPLLASACGDVLFVVEAGRTRTRHALEALSRLEVVGAHVLGGVLTKASPEGRDYGYKNYGYASVTQPAEPILLIPHQVAA